MTGYVRPLVLEAEERIRPHVRETILERCVSLSRLGDADVYVKLENLQHTGSFKVRGALNKILAMDATEAARGVVAASTGNHGAAVAFALSRLGAPGVVFVPEEADESKVASIERHGVAPRRVGGDPVEVERRARRFAEENGMTYVSPYNDMAVVAGQGTIAVELERQLGQFDVLVASLGGGGLVSGIAGCLKEVKPGVHVVACSPENSPVMIRSLAAGRVVDMESLPTLSDGTAGGVEPGAVTFELCRELVDTPVTVSEDEITGALRGFLEEHHMLIEGAAAVAVAGYTKLAPRFAGKRVVIVICGGNIGLEVLKRVLE